MLGSVLAWGASHLIGTQHFTEGWGSDVAAPAAPEDCNLFYNDVPPKFL